MPKRKDRKKQYRKIRDKDPLIGPLGPIDLTPTSDLRLVPTGPNGKQDLCLQKFSGNTDPDKRYAVSKIIVPQRRLKELMGWIEVQQKRLEDEKKRG